MNRNVCAAGGWGRERRRHFRALRGGTCGAVPPFHVLAAPWGVRALQDCRFGSEIPSLLEERTRSPARRTISGTRPTPVESGVSTRGDRACLRAHIPASARNAHAPGPLPARRQIRLPGWTERVLGGVFKAAVPAPPSRPPRSVSRRLLRPPHEPGGGACAARGAGAGGPLACRGPAGGGSGARRAPPAPPLGRSGPHSSSGARGHVGGDGQQRGGRWGRRRRWRAGFLPEPPGRSRSRRQPGLERRLRSLPGGLGARRHGGGCWAGSAAAAAPPAGKSDGEIRSQGA